MMAGEEEERRGACELPPITPRGGERLISPRPPPLPSESSSRGGRAIVAGGGKFRRDNLELLEERWRNRKAPATRESAPPPPRAFKISSSSVPPVPVPTAVEGSASSWVERQLEQVRLFASTQLASSTKQEESVRILSTLLAELKERKFESAESEQAESDAKEQDHEREMAEFQAMMAGNDLEAAEQKLKEIIAAAEEDGEIDENEQAQIDQAKEHLRAMQEKKRAAEQLKEELERKAAEKAELAALMASNDVKAAEKKLREIIAAAEEDGEIDEEEMKEIQKAQKDLEALKKKQERLDKKVKRAKEEVETKKLPPHREERVRISMAAKQTAQERLRLATELRALKGKYEELAADYKKQMSDIQKVEEAFALTLLELQTSRELVVELKKELAEKVQEINMLKKEKSRLENEVEKYSQLANVRKTQLVELKQAFDTVRAKWEKENGVLTSQLDSVTQKLATVSKELEEERREKEKLERSSRRNEDLARLEKDSAMLERTNGDKLRIRCIELDEELSDAQTRCSRQERELAKLEGENSSLKQHLQEAALWHQARVAARPTTKKLLTLPVDAQEVTMPQVSLFLITSLSRVLRITECPIGRESLKLLTSSKRAGLHLYF
ncbi:hypothetical protein GUITHDRAFT_107652 [Guillardia theta CCMP2712]|uniref:Uncharacterized protein n=1 Tax=Guillardia theta (strain CCMP2712) TaxID=905079 RepID=L1JD39_GUITC|nr:hypothetical protein GUITHDRAFT_107652 [Guillardia theta CCMP2712]EKX46448.1 hypothetical protein GUITHDRAFT_107652 [Guillardia theta CCMP2712]|eukprot:XP_005833428.1 hypothetical protein GUITHDRAFT_107652 [Guillardia theta CCMP2712]